ncbi:Rpn family recombination-promoting nuclease/putative transposase [Romboutsia sp.]|uniref:Rpn family recombination-promoting nuclease/putative transposase n=1 Tax=Romboutsia sp. TaxID=1965302 RepID=UPI003F2E219A
MCIELLSPKVDFVFKKIFGSENNKEILISFLNAVIDNNEPITSVEILNTDVEKEFLDDKFSRLDIRAKTNKNHIVNIEIQVKNEYNIIKRSLYYWSKLYTNQMKNKGKYKQLERTICINILDFKCIDNDRYHNVFRLKELETNEELTDTMEIHFIELPKLDTDIGIKNVLEAWLQFIKQPEKNLEMDISEIREAKNQLCKLSGNQKEREMYFMREQSLIQKESALDGAKEEKATEIAKNLLDILDDETISSKLELDIDVVRKLGFED